MSQSVSLVFPHQLFKHNKAIAPGRPVILVEEHLYLHQFKFHQAKLVLHRASMKFYQQYLEEQGHTITYIEAADARSDVRRLISWLKDEGSNEVYFTDTTDNWLERRMKNAAKQFNLQLIQLETPMFLTSLGDAGNFFKDRKTYFQTDFYKWQRKRLNILLQSDGEPKGGKWSFDADNRKPLPKGALVPAMPFCAENKYVAEARRYVAKHFAESYGSMEYFEAGKRGFYATTFDEAEGWLQLFLKERFEQFGVYEDALVANEHYLFHSVLTPMLNTGLLEPAQVVQAALDYARAHEVAMNSTEGFIRQIIGWREFIRIVYERVGTRQRNRNFWGFNRRIPETFWTGNTGIVPVDSTIKKLLQTGYSHHIERLMIMGNFMLLCEFDPHEVYQWFMTLYIDSYDWVMVPNTYGMTQFADGGLMTTKPYISGSNYIMKMGNYAKGDWQKIWDGLFWRFMHVHRDYLGKNMRLNMLIKTFDKMPAEKKQMHLTHAESFLELLDHSQ